MRLLLTTWFSSRLAWNHSRGAIVLLAALLLGGCDLSLATANQGLSDSGNPIVIADNTEAVFLASNCNGPAVATIRAGTDLVDLGPVSSACEQVAYPTEVGYSETGYVPVYSVHRATNSIRCIGPNGCNVRAGPSPTATILSTLLPGQRIFGRGTDATGVIITDGSNYSWWEVVDPQTGQPGDVYGTLVIAF